jgi:hypothetical protein
MGTEGGLGWNLAVVLDPLGCRLDLAFKVINAGLECNVLRLNALCSEAIIKSIRFSGRALPFHEVEHECDALSRLSAGSAAHPTLLQSCVCHGCVQPFLARLASGSSLSSSDQSSSARRVLRLT